MTDLETLVQYRLRQADETINEAETLFGAKCSARSIVNRTYYAIFYAINALLLKEGIALKTSKHIGVISLFDKEVMHTGKIDKSIANLRCAKRAIIKN
jgi:uncharacterized protein (UPF0332 family)